MEATNPTDDSQLNQLGQEIDLASDQADSQRLQVVDGREISGNTPEFEQAQRQRNKVEALLAELKGRIGSKLLRLRRLKFVRSSSFYPRTAKTSNAWFDS